MMPPAAIRPPGETGMSARLSRPALLRLSRRRLGAGLLRRRGATAADAERLRPVQVADRQRSRRRSPPPPGRSRRARRCRPTPARDLKLVPFAEAKLALAPERPPKFSPSYAGAFALDAPPPPAVYKVDRLGGRLDRRHPGRQVPEADRFFRGDRLRRTRARAIKFRLAAEPATLQLTGVGAEEISVIVSPE